MTSSRPPAWIAVLLGLGVVSTVLSVPLAGYVWLELKSWGRHTLRRCQWNVHIAEGANDLWPAAV